MPTRSSVLRNGARSFRRQVDKARSWRRVEGEGGCQGEEKYVIEEIRSVHFFFFLFVRKFFEVITFFEGACA